MHVAALSGKKSVIRDGQKMVGKRVHIDMHIVSAPCEGHHNALFFGGVGMGVGERGRGGRESESERDGERGREGERGGERERERERGRERKIPAVTFIVHKTLIHPQACIQVKLSGPCFKTGRALPFPLQAALARMQPRRFARWGGSYHVLDMFPHA